MTNPISSLRSLRPCADSAAAVSLPMRWAQQTFDLFADRAVLWSKHKTLIIADPHFGKAAAFRAAGVPVPEATTQANLDRLAGLLKQCAAERLVILGDFFHAHHGRADDTLHAIKSWRTRFAALAIVLVRGNHDLHAGDPACEWNIQCVDEPFIDGPLAFVHHPEAAVKGLATFAGHVHPGAILHDNDGASVRLPCFHFSKARAILPAFGEFTGLHPIQPRTGDRVFAIAGDLIVEAPGVRRR